MCIGLLLQPVACFSKFFFVNWCSMTVFCHALAYLPTKARIDWIYLELVRDKIRRKWRDQVKSKVLKRSGTIQTYLRELVQSKLVKWRMCILHILHCHTVNVKVVFAKIWWALYWKLKEKTQNNSKSMREHWTAATCVCKCLHHRLSHVLNVHLRGAQKQFPRLMGKQMWTKCKKSNCTSEKTFTEKKC